ncbi:MAG: M13-type metalloendopeptidase [Acidobacteriota bacterium]
MNFCITKLWLPTATLAAILSFTACATTPAPPMQSAPAPEPTPMMAPTPTPAPMDSRGFDPANLDRSTNACDDFYQFAVGGWMKNNPIPAAYSRWGNFSVLSEKNRTALNDILKDTRNGKAGSNEQKIADFYTTCMDESAVNALGMKPLEPELQRIQSISNRADLVDELARLESFGVAVPFAIGSAQDFKDSTQVAGILYQAGLGLPDRDYYTKDDAKSVELRDKYLQHMTRMFQLMGDDAGQAAMAAKTVMSMETDLAKASMTRVEQRDPNAIYHKMSVAELSKVTPQINWQRYLKEINATGFTSVNVAQPEFMKQVGRMVAGQSLANWKTYLRWQLINNEAPYLSEPFVNENFDFNGKVLTGSTELLPRWRRCVAQTDGAMGEALGQAYVDKNFKGEAKARAKEMVQNLIDALHQDLTTLDWMTPATRQQAEAKLNAFARKIGYPDTWRDYSSLNIDRNSYVQNVLNANRFEFQRDLNKIGKPVDRNEWGMSPPTVNAYYNPSMNEIVFPAGILQPPFYDPNADDAYNYGGMGAVIGHEMSHGFDDQGSQFDAKGNLANWWTPEDKKRFDEKSTCVEKQFDSFEAEKGLHLTGKLVTGESIADLGGLKLAYLAYKKSLEGKADPGIINGFTPDQRFFLGWAQVWATNQRPEAMRMQVATDPHPLARFRVNGPLSNLPEFARAYSCKDGQAMVRPANERCEIW